MIYHGCQRICMWSCATLHKSPLNLALFFVSIKFRKNLAKNLLQSQMQRSVWASQMKPMARASIPSMKSKNKKSARSSARTFKYALKHMTHTSCCQPFFSAQGYPSLCPSDKTDRTMADERALFFQIICQ